MSGGVPAGEIAKERADWLLDAVATATQDRRYLRGDPEYDEWAGEAILLNGEKAIRVAIDRASPAPPIEGRDADVERISKAIYDAVEPLSGDPIAVVLHNSDHLFWDDRLPGDTDVERQLAAVRIICDAAARAALQVLGERG